MHLIIWLPFAFFAILINSPVFALIAGIIYGMSVTSDNYRISETLASNLLQAGIVLLGLTLSVESVINISSMYFAYVSAYILVIFGIGLLLAKIFRIDAKLSFLISSGTAICGATAMVAVSQVIKSKPKELFAAVVIIFLFNIFAVIVFPSVGRLLDLSPQDFGLFAALAIHDTGSVLGAAMSFNNESLETATTVKLFRTLWLVPLILFISFLQSNKHAKPKIPLFIFMFVAAIFINAIFNLNSVVISWFSFTSNTLILAALFCIGAQIKIEQIRDINSHNFLYALTLWFFALVFSCSVIFLF